MRVAGARRWCGVVGVAAVLLAAGLGVAGAEAAEATRWSAQEAVAQDDAHAAGDDEHAEAAAQDDAHAAGDAQHAEEEHAAEEHGESWLQIGFRWINFFLLLGVMWWLIVVPPDFVIETFSFPGLKVFLRDRGKAIVDDRDLAVRQVAEAAEIVEASSQRTERISEELDALLDEARTDAEQDLARAERAAEEAAERVLGTGARDLASREASASRELRAHGADAVVETARRILDEHLGGEDQDRLVRAYLDRLGERVR